MNTRSPPIVPRRGRKKLWRESDYKAEYTSFRQLGGGAVTLGEVRDELTRLPLDLVLGAIARLSAWFVNPAVDAMHPRFQGEWLRLAIVDDFPTALRGAGAMIIPNRVPVTGGRHLFIHEHNLAALTQLALLHSPTDATTRELTQQNNMRVCRLLLILNDHLSHPTKAIDPSSLRDRRRLGAQLLYHGQFDQFGSDGRVPILKLARWQLLLERYLPPHLPSAAGFFREKSGMDLTTYFRAATFLLLNAMAAARTVDRERSPWGLFTMMALRCAFYGEEIAALVARLTQSGEDFRAACAAMSPEDAVYDFRFLQTRPLVEGRPAEVVAPMPSLLIRQLVHFPAILLSAEPGFRRALGYAFEDYAHDLACRVAKGDRQAWDPSKNRNVGSGEIDSLLWSRGTAVLMEHKARHLALTLGSLSAAMGALGPHDDALATLNDPKRPKDDGAVTEALWQFSASRSDIESYLAKRYRQAPTSVRPLIVTLEPFRVEEWLRLGYLDPLASAKARRDGTRARWAAPEWLHIGELEALAQLADDGMLDLEELLIRKSAASSERMDVFLGKQATGHNGLPIDQALIGKAETLEKEALTRYLGPYSGTDVGTT